MHADVSSPPLELHGTCQIQHGESHHMGPLISGCAWWWGCKDGLGRDPGAPHLALCWHPTPTSFPEAAACPCSGKRYPKPAVAHSKCQHELASSAFCCHLPTSLGHTCPKHFLCQPQDPFQSSPEAIPPGYTRSPCPIVSPVVTAITHLCREEKSCSWSSSGS